MPKKQKRIKKLKVNFSVFIALLDSFSEKVSQELAQVQNFIKVTNAEL